MEKKVLAFIEEQKLVPKDKPIICAVSGGVDSVCLLHLFHSLGYPIVLAHVNHHKRKESDLEEQEMKQLAHTLQIPFELFSFYDDSQDNFQAKAHEARYEFFKSLAKKYKTSWIATAHHLDDQAETILMRLLNGSNLYGYGGISIQKKEDDFIFIRPFLCVSKEEIYQYAQKHQIRYFEDASNQSDDYLRNRIRHHILPLLKSETDSYLEKLQEFSIILKQSFDFIRKQSINYLDKQNNNIDVPSFIGLDEALQLDILCLLFERYQIEKNHTILKNCLLLVQENQNKTIHLKGEFFFCVEYGKAFIQRKKNFTSFEVYLSLENQVQILNRYCFYFSKKIPQNNAKYLKLCYNDLKLPFCIRNKKEGDSIHMSYGNKKVSRIMIDAKLPTNKRNETPLIFDGNQTLLWIYDIAKSKAAFEQKKTGDIYLVCEELL